MSGTGPGNGSQDNVGGAEHVQPATPATTAVTADLLELMTARNLTVDELLRMVQSMQGADAAAGSGSGLSSPPPALRVSVVQNAATNTTPSPAAARVVLHDGPAVPTPMATAGPSDPAAMPPPAPLPAAAQAMLATLPSPGAAAAALMAQATDLRTAALAAERSASAQLRAAAEHTARADLLQQVSAPVESGGSRVKLPYPEKFSYDDVQRGRKSRVFFADLERYAKHGRMEPTSLLPQLLKGQLRDDWQNSLDSWLQEHNTHMSWEQA
jgi:hypothetical protein